MSNRIDASALVVLAAVAALNATAGLPAALGQCELARLVAFDGAAEDYFGSAVAVSGSTAVIAAPDDDDNGTDSGSAYVLRYDGSNWIHEQKLRPSDGEAGDRFGSSVAVSGDVAVIGARCDDDNGADSGAAYVFRYDGADWVQEAKLLASDGASMDGFGVSVTIFGDTVVIGAPGNNGNGSGSGAGAAYVFEYNGSSWVQEAKLVASDADAWDQFGYCVAVSGATARRIVVGAYFDDDAGENSGSAYVFRYHDSSWVQETKLLAADGAAQDLFGSSVAICGETAVIGAVWDSDKGARSGSAYVFSFDGESWAQKAKLLAPDGAAGDKFGHCVAISDNPLRRIVVGAWYDDDNGADSGSAYVFHFDGGSWTQETKLSASDGAEHDLFGASVAVSGNTIVIGANHNDDNGECSGSAYVFLSTWVQQARLFSSDSAAGDYFGRTVAVCGNTVVVGAWGNEEAAGSAYVFRYDGSSWFEEQKLLPADVGPGDQFGFSVAICGDTAVIGARFDDDKGTDSGSAYVFRYDGASWVQQAKLLASDGTRLNEFGVSVSIFEDTAVIGAWGNNGSGSGNGAGGAYVFRRDGSSWAQEAKLVASDGEAWDRFGFSVAICGDVTVVGAFGDDDCGTFTGSAYVFRCAGSNWTQEQKLVAADADEMDIFGWSVAISGNAALVGAPWHRDNGSQSGAAYLFRYNGASWVQEAKLLASDGAPGDEFGVASSISGDIAAMGAHFDDDNGYNTGSAYVFRYDGSGWLQEQELWRSRSESGCLNEFCADEKHVAVSGDMLVFGSNWDDDNGPDSGSAFVYRLTGADCNENGLCDSCDIAGGTSQDCDANGVPDECEPDSDGDGVIDGCDDCPNTIPGVPVDGAGCPPAVPGDFDRDGDVDRDDFNLFEACASGPAMSFNPGCENGDFDADDDVDQSDFGVFQLCYSGADNPGDPNCAD